MTKRSAAVTPKAPQPPATKDTKSKAKSAQPPAAKDKASKVIAAVLDGHLAFSEVLHLTRVLSARGGPWSEETVAATVADKTISRFMADGFELVLARHVMMVPNGIFMAWFLGKPKGRPHSGLKEVVHVSRTIRGNLGAVPPSLSTVQANEYIQDYLNDGWSLINANDGFQPLTSDPTGLSCLWVLVR